MARLERLRRMSNVRYWLTPGMGVKRHVFVAALGTLLLVAGVIGNVLWMRQAEDYLIFGAIEQRLASRVWEVWGGWVSLLALLTGLSVAVWAVGRLNRSLLSNWMPRPKDAAVLLHQRVSLARGPRIVALGGGTGLSNLLRGLREYTSNITAVVSVSDDGGSSGRLRDAFGIPAPGDLTDCLAALSDNESQVSRLLEYRFERGAELEGHTFGNLFITTLTEVEGDFARAIRVLNALLNLCGAVYPITTDPTSLRVIKRSGEEVVGESKVSTVPGPVACVSLEPPDPAIVPDVAQALANADLVVLGPGSLFTSTLPPLLVPDAKRALLETQAPIVYLCNVMTEPGETDGFSAWDHVAAIHQHLGRYPDQVLLNTGPVDKARRERYRALGAEVIRVDLAPFKRAGVAVSALDLLGPGPQAQHDAARLAAWLNSFARFSKVGA